MTREEELEAGRAYNRVVDYNIHTNDAELDPTGDRGWARMQAVCDMLSKKGSRSYEQHLEHLVSEVLSVSDDIDAHLKRLRMVQFS